MHVCIAADMHDGSYDVMPDVSIATMRTFLKAAAYSADEPSAKALAGRTGLPYSKFMRHIEFWWRDSGACRASGSDQDLQQ